MLCHIQLTLHYLLSSNILRQYIYITLSQKIGFICQELFWTCSSLTAMCILFIYMDKYSFFTWIISSGLNALWRKKKNWDDVYSRDTGLKGSVVESEGQISLYMSQNGSVVLIEISNRECILTSIDWIQGE